VRRSRPKPACGTRSPAVLALGLALTGLAGTACSNSHGAESHEGIYGPYVPPAQEAAIEVPPPPFTDGAFPCSDCHDPEIPVNTQRRELTMAHEEIELKHAAGQRWCLDCHSATDRDHLHLANGDLVPFEESYRLCGQCHGDKYRDWRAGVHGRRTGHWDDGEKKYLLCVGCHNAHNPRFAPLKPEPVPQAPRRTP
jgi:hypothetical protein